MKRSNPSDDPSNPPKKAKLAHEITVPNAEANDISSREEISTLCDLVPYPPDLKVRGKDFEIPVHGVFLSMKSKSLQGIICQPGNLQDRIWILDAEITRLSAIQFLSHFYPNVEPKFDGFGLQDFLGYQILIDMHLSEENGAILKMLRSKIYNGAILKMTDDDHKLLVSVLDFCCRKSITLDFTSWATLYKLATLRKSHLDWCHFSYFLDHCFTSEYRNIDFAFQEFAVVLFYIALKNDVSFNNLDLAEINPPDNVSLHKVMTTFNKDILKGGFDKAKANDMFTKAMLWVAKVK